jgi:hypothetical protein
VAAPENFLRPQDNVLHPLECRACRDPLTLPRRFRTGVVVMHLQRTERHKRRRREPYAQDMLRQP